MTDVERLLADLDRADRFTAAAVAPRPGTASAARTSACPDCEPQTATATAAPGAPRLG
ncbi:MULTISPECIES: hypothetical protein [Streptomyces]|uniref:hypothetical protein n=1 Tax=Streptomyces TaxID=1883 RepID=UPI00142E2494|nr:MULTISPECIES: hypothetical protein [Streptomyces]